MFPSSLQKHLHQLDKEISLLEGECINLEIGQKRKCLKSAKPQNKSNKVTYSFKSHPVRDEPKMCTKHESGKKIKKIVLPYRIPSSSSIQSNGSKPSSEVPETVVKKSNKQRGINTECTLKCCQGVNKKSHGKKNDDSVLCLSCLEEPCRNTNACKSGGDHCDDKNGHLLHKEVLFSKPGRIEVTVKQVPVDGCEKEHLLNKQKNNLKKSQEKEISSCHCRVKGQKWSEILSWDRSKKEEKDSEVNISGETHFQSEKRSDCLKNVNGTSKKDNNETPVKLSSKTDTVTLSPVRREPEKDNQCYLMLNNDFKELPTKKSNPDPVLIFQKLISELQQKSDESEKKTVNDLEKMNSKTLPQNVPQIPYKNSSPEENIPALESVNSKNDCESYSKQYSENLLKEKELLAQELIEKEKVIATMKRREEEYQSVISTLKLNVDKVKNILRDEEHLKKELCYMTQKLMDQKKVIEILKIRHLKTQELLQKTAIDNDKLRTRIKICELEAQKADVLLAGKDAEIKRYKEEIQNFQRQISEHLESLRSNAQALNVEKVMNAILQQSQFFISKEMNSIKLENDEKDSTSSRQNVLVHSSPTSSKYSDLDSSWKRISSIHESDPSVRSEVLINLHDSTGNDFIRVYGGDSSSESQKSRQSRKALINKFSENDLRKKSSSFTSCLSLEEDNDGDDDDDEDNNNKINSKQRIEIDSQHEVINLKPVKHLTSKKVQNDIEELLKNMRLKRTEDFRSALPDNLEIEDLFNSSQISSISVVSENAPLVKTPRQSNRRNN